MPEVLLVSGRFPPAGGVGGLRALRLARQLPALGWTVRVLALDPKTAPWRALRDEALATAIPPATVVEYEPLPSPARPWHRARALRALRAEGLARLLAWRAVPDATAPAFARAALPPVDAVWTTGPPHAAHVAGLRAQRRGARWVMDYRDPWQPYGARPPRVERWLGDALERACLARADAVTVTTAAWGRALEAAMPSLAGRVHVIHNTAEDVSAPAAVPRGERCVVAHVGTFNPARDPRPLLAGLAEALRRGVVDPRRFRLRLVGWIAPEWRAAVGAAAAVETTGFLPRERALEELRCAHALLLLGLGIDARAREALPAKTFECLASGRPILALVDGRDAQDLLAGQPGVACADPRDAAAIARALGETFAAWERGALSEPVAGRRVDDPAQAARRVAELLAGAC